MSSLSIDAKFKQNNSSKNQKKKIDNDEIKKVHFHFCYVFSFDWQINVFFIIRGKSETLITQKENIF